MGVGEAVRAVGRVGAVRGGGAWRGFGQKKYSSGGGSEGKNGKGHRVGGGRSAEGGGGGGGGEGFGQAFAGL